MVRASLKAGMTMVSFATCQYCNEGPGCSSRPFVARDAIYGIVTVCAAVNTLAPQAFTDCTRTM